MHLPSPKLTQEQAVALYQQPGQSLRSVGHAAGCSPSTVLDWLAKAGVERRKPGRPLGTTQQASVARHKHWQELRSAGWTWAAIARDQKVTHPAVMKAVRRLEQRTPSAE